MTLVGALLMSCMVALVVGVVLALVALSIWDTRRHTIETDTNAPKLR